MKNSLFILIILFSRINGYPQKQLKKEPFDELGREFVIEIPNKKNYFFNSENNHPRDSIYLLSVLDCSKLKNGVLKKYTNLTILKISGNLSKLPDDVFELPNLREIVLQDVRHSDWGQFFLKLSRLKKLTSIEIYFGNMLIIPETFVMLNNIERFKVINTPIIGLPDNFSNLKNLKYLMINETNIRYLPDDFQFKNLLFLDISENKFNGVPEELNQSPNLEFLKFSGNTCFSSDDSILCKNPKLTYLSIADCGLEIFPNKLICLKNLKSLNIGGNRITDISDECLVGLKNLEFLDWSDFAGNQDRLKMIREKIPNCKIWATNPVKIRPHVDNFEVR